MIIRKFTLDQDSGLVRPFHIFGAIMHRTFGDFVDQLLFVATVKEHMPKSRLEIFYRPDRNYKEKLIQLVPQIDHAWSLENGMPIELFDTAYAPPVNIPQPWIDQSTGFSKLVLTPAMCAFETLPTFPKIAAFQIPDHECWDARLAERVEKRWFVVIHYRENNFGSRKPDPQRDLSLEYTSPVYKAILAAGGQVVRIGHPGMSPLPKEDGMVDLASDDVLLQATAISRARFFMELSPSGPASLALPFGVPILRCNQVVLRRTFEDMSLIMPMRALDSEGNDRTMEVVKNGTFGALRHDATPGITAKLNTTEQLLEGLELMLKRVKGTGWRTTRLAPAERSAQQTPGKLTLPFSRTLGVHLLI